MNCLYPRSLCFVKYAERSLHFYTERLGFSLDWDSNDGVFQVSLLGIQTLRVDWERPTLVIKDVDANQLFFWLPHHDFTNL